MPFTRAELPPLPIEVCHHQVTSECRNYGAGEADDRTMTTKERCTAKLAAITITIDVRPACGEKEP